MNKIHSIKELKTGDVVVFRCNYSGVVITEFNTVIAENKGYINLGDRESFKSEYNSSLDIVRVYRPRSLYECTFYNPRVHDLDNLIYAEKDEPAITWDSFIDEILSSPSLYDMTPERMVLQLVAPESIIIHIYSYQDKYYLVAFRNKEEDHIISFRECTEEESRKIDAKRRCNNE